LRLENYDGGANGPYIELYNNSASPAAPGDNDYTGIISFKNRNSAQEEITYSQIRSQSTDVTDAIEDGVMTFHTRNNGTFGERLRISPDGKIGINATNPQSMLEVLESSSTQSETDKRIAIFRKNGTAVGDEGYIHLTTMTGHYGVKLGYRNEGGSPGYLNQGFFISTVNSGETIDNHTKKFVIKSDGNVGIGEDNPTSKLVVEGGIVVNNANLTVDKHIIDGTDDWAGASHAIHHKRSFTHNTWTNIFKFYRSTTSADNNAVGTYGGSLHISYIYDRDNTVHATGYDVFPFVVRSRSSNNLSGNFASQIINLEEIIGATVEVRFTNATANQIDVQVKFFRSDNEDTNIENLVHAWIDGGGVATNSSRFLYPSILT